MQVFFYIFFSFFRQKNSLFGRGKQKLSKSPSIKIISSPMRLMHRHGMTKSCRFPTSPKHLHLHGTMIAKMHPEQVSTSTSETNPSLAPSQTLTTSLHLSVEKRLPIVSPHGILCKKGRKIPKISEPIENFFVLISIRRDLYARKKQM